ncbi:hypothetical protein V500_00338 [Pseudogymnoascus sp. VKM F-4518 (FW-2643)]|nr:hypothetical protein V500_00338 [Pseudogymnoascus sp. VKM F-4518 (FW-2643)]
MAPAPFKPYWRPVAGPYLGHPTDPYSWAFFVVAQIGGRRRPIAIVSSVADNHNEEETVLRGYPLTAACHRIVTIFSDQANHRAIRAELALAAGYYVRDGNREYSPELVELPDLNRREFNPSLRRRNWYHTSVREFPFISACLLQGVAFNTQQELAHPAFPEPLGTVYRDTSIEWGMVVVDITNLDAVSYGIVGFSVGPMTFIKSRKHEKHPPDLIGIGFHFVPGELRVMDKMRPRRPMSAAKYMAEFEHTISPTNNVNKLIAKVPRIDVAAMDLVWPPSIEQEIDLLLGSLRIDANRSLLEHYQAITSLIQRILASEDPDISILKLARTMPNFREVFSRVLLQDSARLLRIPSSDRLITMAFVNGEHLSLEQLSNLPVEAISAVLSAPSMAKITSISICINTVQGTPAQLAHALSQVERLRKLYFLQSPTRESDTLSAQLFAELASNPQILQRMDVMFAGAYSAALRRRFWLPTAPRANLVQVAPLEIFPVQQILVLDQIYSSHSHIYVHLGDALLRPERFAAGFLIYIQSLLTSTDEYTSQPMNLFSFSSAPSFLDSDPETAAEISPIFAESFAVPKHIPLRTNRNPYRRCWPQMRDLVPGGWTVIVSLETHSSSRALRCPYDCHCIRYAFIRARQQRIVVDHPLLVSPGPKELEVVGIKEFLSATAPGIAHDIIDRSIQRAAERIARNPYEGPLLHKERISVLSQDDAAEMLLDFLENARKVKESLRAAMDEEPEDSSVGAAGFSWRWLLVLCQFRIVELPSHSVLLPSFGKVMADYNCG